MNQDLRQKEQSNSLRHLTLAAAVAELNRAASGQPLLSRMFQQDLLGEQQICVTQLRGGIAFDTVQRQRYQSAIYV